MSLRDPRLAALLFVVAIAIGASVGWRAHFETHDDVFAIRAFSGAPFDAPDPYVPTFSFSCGQLFAALYRARPDISWYGIALYLSLGLALTLLVAPLFRRVLHDDESWLPLAGPLIALVPVIVYVVLLPSYTAAALLLFGAALVSWREHGRPSTVDAAPEHGRPSTAGGRRGQDARSTLALAIVSLVLALFWRWRLVGLLLLLFPLFGTLRLRNRGLALLLLSGLAFLGADRLAFRLIAPTAAQQFARYNFARSRFHDTADGEFRGDRTPDALRVAGWSQTQYEAFRRWWLYDPAFNRRQIEAFLAANRPSTSGGLNLSLRRAWFNASHAPELALMLVSLCAALLALPRHSPRGGIDWRRWLWIAPMGALLLYVLGYRFIDRVVLPFVAWFVVLAAQSAIPRRAPRASERFGRAQLYAWLISLCVLTLAVALVTLPFLRSVRTAERIERAVERAFREARQSLAPQTLVIPMEHTVERLSGRHPLRDHRGVRPLHVVPSAAMIHSPYYRATIARLALPDGLALLRASVTRSDIVFLSARGATRRRFVERYLSSLVGGRRVRLVRIATYPISPGLQLRLYRAQATTPRPPSGEKR